MPKWIFVTGGVLSGLGKGLISASVSKLLQERDQEIVPLKCDGYLNVDPGTMNPHEHGEVFVLDDGTEVDMDFGHYERFLDIEGEGDWNLTSGKIFQEVIDKEREGDYLGKTVQMVPHVTDEIKDSWREAAEEKDADIIAVEVGGTVGDIENMLYLEAVRQLRSELPEAQTFHIHATLVPYLETTGEQKTKPTQHSVKELRETGLEPDMIVGRSEEKLQEETVEKIALFCDVPEKAVISDPNIEDVYEIPLLFDEQNAGQIVADKLELPGRDNGMKDWRRRVENLKNGDVAQVAICGKYTDMDDSYVSVEEALEHAAAELGGNVKIKQLGTENFNPEEELSEFDGVVIPGGFGKRGVEGKIDTARYCRENNVPILGLCYGMQLMTIEYARNVLGLDATSAELEDGEEHLVIDEMPEQKDVEEMGGTMRLGSYTAKLEGQVREIYGKKEVAERHRHRFEVNNEYIEQLEKKGLRFSGMNKEKDLVEYIELPENDYYIATQAHPEFTSRFADPNPLYVSFLKAASQ